MNLYRKLRKKPFIFKRTTGLHPKEFEQIRKKLQILFSKRILQKKQIAGRPYGVQLLENQLLCLLFYYRTYTTQLFISFFFQVDTATISRTISPVEPILAEIVHIKKEKVLTEKELQTLLIDCTEQSIRRPKKAQQKYFSGKKKRHTIKTCLLYTSPSPRDA